MNKQTYKEITENMTRKNKNLSVFACDDASAFRFQEMKNDFRTDFFRDIDKIIYTLSYVRYIDKTQVFSNIENDMISKRMTHVQMVSKIARTIGRALNLNEDLIEAASLGHDLGHTPFGHVGENILNKISVKNNQGYFAHNVQSVRTLMNIENNGLGSNISVQVLDAIFCHNGEKLEKKYIPEKKSPQKFLLEYSLSYENKDIICNCKPMTLEGCVVRISDIIAYVGKDIEDAVRLNKIKFSDIPLEISSVLGSSNSDIVNTIVLDIIENSTNKNYITMSDKIYTALNKLVDFNYKHIYYKANSKYDLEIIECQFEKLFNLYCKQISSKQETADIYCVFLNQMSEQYNKSTTIERKAIDFIAGMTDDYFKIQFNKNFN